MTKARITARALVTFNMRRGNVATFYFLVVDCVITCGGLEQRFKIDTLLAIVALSCLARTKS